MAIPFSNQATLSYNNIVRNSNIATGEIVEVLSATKSPISDSYTAEQTLSYSISIINSGATPMINVSVNDNLGAYETPAGATVYPLEYVPNTATLYINGVETPIPTITEGQPVVFSGFTIPAGGNAVIIYEANVTNYAPLDAGSRIVNDATVNADGITQPVVATSTLPVLDGPYLSIAKSVSPTSVTENGTVTYTFTLQNYGNVAEDATGNAVVEDILNPILTNLSVYFNGTPWTEGTQYTYEQATGTFRTVAGNIVIPAATFNTTEYGVVTVVPGSSTLTISGTI